MNHPKIDLIRSSIAKADRHESKLIDGEGPMTIGGYTGKRIRHLMNNLGAGSNAYLEVGCHRGSLFCATGFRNKVHPRVAIDNLSEFDDGTVKNELIKNCDNFLEGKYALDFKNCWDVDYYHDLFDLYLFDGPHDIDSQRRALTHFLPAMASEFIFCVDDAMWDDVRKGTNQALAELAGHGVQNLFDTTLFTGQMGDGDGYWNGFRVILLKKL